MDTLCPLSEKVQVKIVGWLPVVSCLITTTLATFIATTLSHNSMMYFPPQRAVDTIVPLFFGLQSAFLLSPESEPSLELLLSCKHSMGKVLWERESILVFLLGLVALLENVSTVLLLPGQELLATAVLRWLPACIFIGGVATYTTLLTRQGVFGALIAFLLWSGMLFGMDSLLVRFPFLWLIHVYLQPENIALPLYLLNRLTLIALGLGLVALSANLANDEEHMLGLKGKKI